MCFALGLVVRFVRVEERLERHLGVDHDLPGAGEGHDHVGPELSVGTVGGDLLFEVAVLDHAGHLDDTPQLHLAPTTTRGG